MAVGDDVQGIQSVAANAFFDIKPINSADQWAINNVYYGGACEFYVSNVDNTLQTRFDSDITNGARLGGVYRVTTTQFIRIKNVSAAAIVIAYDGVQTR